MKKSRCKIGDCSSDDLLALARKSGFVVLEGGRHLKVKTNLGKFITTIPRHCHIKKYMAKSIVEAFNQFGANIEIC